ncbi:Securin [Dissostichus eleginoides]|uniref:Securin n=1 Tax=Dissostichus eleginoides TaxID=100907 RepID=A0AAD9CNH6_DISEL|nr:Securin [Dissostichus eleginoides]
MAHIIFAEREMASLHPPTLKMRQRIQSAPEKLGCLITPSRRKAFGAVNQKISTPARNTQEKKTLKPQETKVKHASEQKTKVEYYAEIEKFIPYDPLEFERYSIPEDLIPLGSYDLPGLARFPEAPDLFEGDDFIEIAPLPNLSPVKMPDRSDDCSALAAFLQTLDELTAVLTSESFTD